MERYRRLAFALCLLAISTAGAPVRADLPATSSPIVEMGIDRSNMSTEWSLAPPSEPDVYPFNGSYNGQGVFEARRVAVFDGIARLHTQWFRDGFGADTPADAAMFVDTVRRVHERGMKILAVVGPTRTDYDPHDVIPGNPKVNGCQWSTAPLSKIDLAKFEHRIRVHFDALKAAGVAVDAFEIGNELDLYCNDADMPETSEFAAHHWKWFLTSEQVHRFAAGYAPFLKTFAGLIKEYFPGAKIITFGMSNPSGNSAPLIAALANFTDASGKTFDYTSLVDGYGTHIYPSSVTTLRVVQGTTAELTAQAGLLPHAAEKPLWITEWNEAGSAFWASHKWYFQYDRSGNVGGDLNLAAAPFPAMDRAQVIRSFESDVIGRLRSQPRPVNVGYLFYYAYDAAGKTAMCDDTNFDKSRGISGVCYSGVIDPVDGKLLPDVAAAVVNGHAVPPEHRDSP
jgi:hypothetical protein